MINHEEQLEYQSQIIPGTMLLHILQIQVNLLLHDDLDIVFFWILRQTSNFHISFPLDADKQ